MWIVHIDSSGWFLQHKDNLARLCLHDLHSDGARNRRSPIG